MKEKVKNIGYNVNIEMQIGLLRGIFNNGGIIK